MPSSRTSPQNASQRPREPAPAPEIAPRQRSLVLDAPRQWEAISSPTRFEILEQMRSAAPCSVAQLAQQMDRPADGLYHHLRKLLAAGLLREVEQRQGRKQVERVYDLSFDELVFEIDPRTGRNVREMRRLSGALLRLCGRVFGAALDNPALGSGPAQNAWSRLDTTWLTHDGLADLNGHLSEIARLVRQGNQRRQGQLITIGTFGGPALRPRHADGSKPSRRSDKGRGAKAGKPRRMYRLIRQPHLDAKAVQA